MWLANPNPLTWVTVCHAHAGLHAHLSLCSYADSHISCFLNPVSGSFLRISLGVTLMEKNTKKNQILFPKAASSFVVLRVLLLDKKPLWICEVTSPIGEVKTEQKQAAVPLMTHHELSAVPQKEGKEKKKCLWTEWDAFWGWYSGITVCVCAPSVGFSVWRNGRRGPDSPRLRSQRQSGQDYHITDRIPFPYKVTSFVREMETDLINKRALFEISLLSIFRHEELID